MSRDNANAVGPIEGSHPPRPRLVRFGVFEFDLVNLKLSRDGQDLGLQQQPGMLLAQLVSHPGTVVSREQLRETIWPSGTYVEFDFGLNSAVNRLRRALRDSAAEPRYIQTVPKQGYRFVAPVEFIMPAPDRRPALVEVASVVEEAEPETAAVPESAPAPESGPRRNWIAPSVVGGRRRCPLPGRRLDPLAWPCAPAIRVPTCRAVLPGPAPRASGRSRGHFAGGR